MRGLGVARKGDTYERTLVAFVVSATMRVENTRGSKRAKSWFYPYRAPGCYRDHRDFDWAASPSRPEGSGSGEPDRVLKQPAIDLYIPAHLLSAASDVREFTRRTWSR